MSTQEPRHLTYTPSETEAVSRPYRAWAVAAGLILVMAGCAGSSDGSSTSRPTDTQAASSDDTSPSASNFAFDGVGACDFISDEEVASTFSASEVRPDAVRDEVDQKVCRYEVILDGGQYSALIVSINANDSQDQNPNQYSNRLAEALSAGLEVPGVDAIQEFSAVTGPGTEAAYSGNLPDDKNLIFRIDEDYLIGIEYNQFVNGEDIGDQSGTLIALAGLLLD